MPILSTGTLSKKRVSARWAEKQQNLNPAKRKMTWMRTLAVKMMMDDEEEEEVMTITRIGKDDGGSIVLDPLGVVLGVLGLLLQHHDVWVHLCSLSFTHSLLSVLGI